LLLPRIIKDVPLAGGDAGIRQTLRELSRLANQGRSSPVVIRTAQQVTRGLSGERQQAEAIFKFVQGIPWHPDPDMVEHVVTPELLIRNHIEGTGREDCESLTLLLSTMLSVIAVRNQFLVISIRPDQDMHHILLEALIEGRWVPMEPSLKDVQMGYVPPGITRWWRINPANAVITSSSGFLGVATLSGRLSGALGGLKWRR